MHEVEVGARFDLKELSFFGIEEVNALLRGGAKVLGMEPGGILMKKLGEAEGHTTMTVSGFALKVQLESPGSETSTKP